MMPRRAYFACVQVCQATRHIQGNVLAPAVPPEVSGPVI